MSFSDEILMAYADGELETALRTQVEEAMRVDPAVAAAVERHRALRAGVFAAFAGVLDEPVPERLQPRSAGAGHVRVDALQAAGARPLAARWSWPQWGAMAASLVVGILAGSVGWHGTRTGDTAAPLARVDGTLVAQGALAQALSQQLASDQTQGADLKLGVSFKSKDGSYCRSFMLGSAGGLACRSGGAWRVPVLAEGETQHGGAYRQAGSAMPPAVLDAIDQRIAGGALDAQGERAARGRHWEDR
ncbi:MAG: anti-sigma factor family protein [Telluria sp.]